VLNDVIRAADEGDVTALVLLDLSSVFDSVDHATQQRFFIEGSALMWFQSYLSDRSQVFRANGKDSKAIRVNCSVPRGSVLGPLEFISYTGDVTDIFERHHIGYHLFTDDKCYKSVAPSEVDLARACLRACVADVHQWCQSRRLHLNSSKSEIIWLGTRHTLQKIATSIPT